MPTASTSTLPPASSSSCPRPTRHQTPSIRPTQNVKDEVNSPKSPCRHPRLGGRTTSGRVSDPLNDSKRPYQSDGSHETPIDVRSESSDPSLSSSSSPPPPPPAKKSRAGAFGAHAKKPRTNPPIGRTMSRELQSAATTPVSEKRHEGQVRIVEGSSTPLGPGSSPNVQLFPAPSSSQSRRLPPASFPKGTTPTPRAAPSTFKPASPKITQSAIRRSRTTAQSENDPNPRLRTLTSTAAARVENSRPKRVRPAPGTYTIPLLDAPLSEWPTHRASPATAKRRRTTGSVSLPKSADTLQTSTPNAKSPQEKPATTTSISEPSGQSIQSSERNVRQDSSATTLASAQTSPAKIILIGEILPDAEEEPEPVEEPEPTRNVTPTPTSIEKDDDVLAEFEGFQFESPSPTVATSRLSVAEPKTPTRTPNKASHSSRHSLHASGAGQSPMKNLTPRKDHPTDIPISATTLKQGVSGVSSHYTPRRSQPRSSLSTSATKRQHLLDTILADANAGRAAAAETAAKLRAERRKRMEELQNDEDDDEEDMIDDMKDILASARDSPESGTEENPELRRSARIPSMTAVDSGPIERIRPLPPPDPRAAVLEQLVRMTQRAALREVSSARAEAFLAFIREGDSPEKGDPHPTPMSFAAADEEMKVEVDEEALDKALKGLPENMVDKGTIRDLHSREESVDDGWCGFWEGPEVKREQRKVEVKAPNLEIAPDDQKGKILADLVRNNDLLSISAMLPIGLFDTTLSNPATMTSFAWWLLKSCLSDVHPEIALHARLSLLNLVSASRQPVASQTSPRPDPFAESELPILLEETTGPLVRPCIRPRDFSDLIVSIFRSMGMRKDLSPCNTPAVCFDVWSERQTTSEFLCKLVKVTFEFVDMSSCGTPGRPFRMDMLSPYDGSRLGAILLLLSMDNSTTAPVRRAIAETLPLLYAVDTDEGSRACMAKDIYNAVELFPLTLQARIIMTIPDYVQEARRIARYLSIGLLIPDGFERDTEEIEDGPYLGFVTQGARVIYDELVKPEPDHQKVEAMIVFFTRALGNIQALVDECGENGTQELDEVRKIIVTAMNRIRTKSARGTIEYQNKTRLSQIHVNMGLLIASAVKRRARRKLAEMKGMKEGVQGQMKLDFGNSVS